MLTLRKHTDDLLVFGLPRDHELLGLFLFTGGIFGSALVVAWIAEGRADMDWIAALPFLVSAALGSRLVFFTRRLVLDRRRAVMTEHRPFRRSVRTALQDVVAVELMRVFLSNNPAQPLEAFQECKLVMADGSHLSLERGSPALIGEMARTIAQFGKFPLEEHLLKPSP